MKTPTPFCCDITSGKPEEQKEFKKLFDEASNFSWWYLERYYGYLLQDKFSCYTTLEIATKRHPNIIPLTEGISILKEMVGEEEKPNEITFTEEDMIKCFKAGVDFARNVGNPSNSEYIMSVITSKIQPKP